jgi:hypothetical protein
MTEYALAPNAKLTSDSPYRTPRVMLEQGLLVAYRVRGNGTMRHLELYPLGSTTREAAEWISDAIEVDGRSVASVARELHVSTPTIRRYIEGLELTEEIEAGEWDELSFDSAGNPVWVTVSEEEEVGVEAEITEEAPTPAPKPTPVRTRRTRAPRSVAEVVKSQGLPWPTDEERAAVLADTVPGAQCEPVGTPAEEVEATLAASLRHTTEAELSGVERQALAKGAPLAVCFCGDLGQHAPGAAGCKNSPAIPRRVRSHG